jgi:hypothetical protein
MRIDLHVDRYVFCGLHFPNSRLGAGLVGAMLCRHPGAVEPVERRRAMVVSYVREIPHFFWK